MKYRQQAEDLELNMSLEPNIDDELWEYDAASHRPSSNKFN